MIRPPVLMFGVPIADVNMTECLDVIDGFVQHGRRTGRTHQVATVNVDFLVNARNDPKIASILQQADLCLADGMPVVWMSKLMRRPLPGRVAGSDLVPLLVGASADRGWRIHIFGSRPDVAKRATAWFHDRYPNANVTLDPGPVLADPTVVDDAVLDSIAKARPDVLCVALGNPKQERFIRAHRQRLGIPVLIGIGGSLDMLVGERRRAPRLVQHLGMEWVYRAAQEPSRLGPRYLNDIRHFVPMALHELRLRRRPHGGAGLVVSISDSTVDARLTPGAPPNPATWVDAAAALRGGTPLLVTVEDEVDAVANLALDELIGLIATAQAHSALAWSDPLTVDVIVAANGGLTRGLLGVD